MPNTIALEIVVDDKGTPTIRRFGKNVGDLDPKGRKAGRAMSIFKKSVDGVARTTRSAVSGVGRLAKGLAGLAIGGVAVGIAGITAALFGLSRAIGVASDLEEVSSKFDVVFEGQRGTAEAWAKTLVDSYAMSTREAKQYLSAMQDLLVPMGMVPEKAGEMSNEIVKLAADLGSFNNLQTGQVIDDMQSALVGNYETMKKYGVVLTAATVQEKALAMGLAATKGELTAAQKAQAAYQLIVEGSQAAVGDMARTAGSYANQVKRLKANWEEFMGFVGSAVLPYATRIVKAINTWFEANKELIEQKIEVWAQKLGVWFGKAWEALGSIVQSVREWYKANENLIDESVITYLKGLWEVAKGIATAFELVGKAIGWAAAKIVELIEKGKELKAVRWVTGLLGGGSAEGSSTAIGGTPAGVTSFQSGLSSSSSSFGTGMGGEPTRLNPYYSDGTAGSGLGAPEKFKGFQTGTGSAGLPHTGYFYGHQGEIVKSPEESDRERQGAAGGNTYHIHLSTTFGDEGSMRRAAARIKGQLQQLDHRWGTA